MGYSHFDGNEEDVMEAMFKHETLPKSWMKKEYPYQAKSLLRKKMISSAGKSYAITERGKSAITQQKRSGEYWVAPLHPKPFNFGGTARISRELVGYVK